MAVFFAAFIKVPTRSASSQKVTPKNLDAEWVDYLKLPVPALSSCPLLWWKEMSPRFLVLSQAARRLLAVPASSAPSERVFSALGRITDDERARMKPDMANVLTFLAYNDI